LNRDLLGLVLNSPVPHARIAARRVERMWEHSAARPVAVGAAPNTDRPSAGEKSPGTVAANDGAIVVRTVVEAMRYDVETFTVTAGKPVKVRFVNDDYTPHNLIIGTPGSATEIGAAADRLGADGFARRFVPKTDKILAATDLLNHQKSQVLEFRAPSAPGDYDILCTFPGHRQTMHGVMRVVK
jgi:plastocyanin